MAKPRVTLIWNPSAGVLPRRAVPRRVARAIAGWAVLTQVRETSSPGDAERFASEVSAEECDLLLIAGGDGTVNASINGLRAEVPVGILPLGTANVLARELGIPTHSLRAMCAALGQARERPIDVGSCNGRRFLAMASAGFDAAVVREVGPPEKDLLGPTAFALRAVQALPGHESAMWRIRADGEVIETSATMILVSNTARYGGSLQLSPGASLDDGWLDMSVFVAATGRQFIRQLVALMTRGDAAKTGVLCRRCREIELEGIPPQPVQIDGEVLGTTPARIQIEPRSLTVLSKR